MNIENMSQSTTTSEAWKTYVENVKDFDDK
jgi:hypothetical protein